MLQYVIYILHLIYCGFVCVYMYVCVYIYIYVLCGLKFSVCNRAMGPEATKLKTLTPCEPYEYVAAGALTITSKVELE